MRSSVAWFNTDERNKDDGCAQIMFHIALCWIQTREYRYSNSPHNFFPIPLWLLHIARLLSILIIIKRRPDFHPRPILHLCSGADKVDLSLLDVN